MVWHEFASDIFNWESIFKIITLIVGVVIAYYQIPRIKTRFRSNLKVDLDILNAIEDKKSPTYKKVNDYVNKSVDEIYSEPIKTGKSKVTVGQGISIFVFLFLFCYGAYQLLTEGFTLWLLLTGIITFFVFLIVIGSSVETNYVPCINCGMSATWVDRANQYHCYNCKTYFSKEQIGVKEYVDDTATCNKCNKKATWFEINKKQYYCSSCK